MPLNTNHQLGINRTLSFFHQKLSCSEHCIREPRPNQRNNVDSNNPKQVIQTCPIWYSVYPENNSSQYPCHPSWQCWGAIKVRIRSHELNKVTSQRWWSLDASRTVFAPPSHASYPFDPCDDFWASRPSTRPINPWRLWHNDSKYNLQSSQSVLVDWSISVPFPASLELHPGWISTHFDKELSHQLFDPARSSRFWESVLSSSKVQCGSWLHIVRISCLFFPSLWSLEFQHHIKLSMEEQQDHCSLS